MKKIYGNVDLINKLNTMNMNKKNAHAIIFHGEKGVGKKLITNYYISQLLCENPHNGSPCGVCASCRNVEENNHPDVMYMQTEGKLENYSVNSAKKIISDIFVKPNNNTGKKIYIFRDCRDMSVQLQNMLLKIIEEPPGYAYFVFTSNSKYEFLSTIISRCVCFGVSQCTEQEAEMALLESGYNIEEVKNAISCFHGNIGFCIDYIMNEKLKKQVELIKSIADSIINRDEYSLNFLLFSVGSNRSEIYDIFRMFDNLVRDSVAIYYDINARTIGCHRESAIRISKNISPYQLLDIHNTIEKSWAALKANVNPTLVLSAVCAEIMQIRLIGNSLE